MVIGWPEREPKGGAQASASAWAQVEAAQRDVRLPCLLVPQPSHAVLAGELAAALLPAPFGPLPSEIEPAIRMHDTGWAASDAQQIHRLRSPGAGANMAPVSFIAVSPGEAVEAWTASIDAVEAFSKPGAIIVSRHFSLLAQHDQAHHQRFLQAERIRQRRLEASIGKNEDPLTDTGTPKGADLDRWTSALGFCDLVSLYLLSGFGREVEFPLAHPAAPEARTAPRVTMRIEGRQLHFLPAIARGGCALTIQALNHPLSAQGPRAETLAWEVL
jgi:Protein of unknown function (DUF3891)